MAANSKYGGAAILSCRREGDLLPYLAGLFCLTRIIVSFRINARSRRYWIAKISWLVDWLNVKVGVGSDLGECHVSQNTCSL